MNNNFQNELKNQNSDWTPDPNKLGAMMSKAHQKADDIRSFRHNTVSALTVLLCCGLVWITQSTSLPVEPGKKDPQKVSSITTQPTSVITKAAKNKKNSFSIEETQSMQALAEASLFATEDFDFIEESLSSHWALVLD